MFPTPRHGPVLIWTLHQGRGRWVLSSQLAPRAPLEQPSPFPWGPGAGECLAIPAIRPLPRLGKKLCPLTRERGGNQEGRSEAQSPPQPLPPQVLLSLQLDSPQAGLSLLSSAPDLLQERPPWGHPPGGSHTCCCWLLWPSSPLQVGGLIWAPGPSTMIILLCHCYYFSDDFRNH